ncbi:hypothetical protein [Rubritalea profundi]|uniref:Capsular biosynthesis protein n=1 Tax=Rubritalea profundi TaxID=1658618 RepID=A0A2S7TY41_9BACT|nr:hypothetical protein [Rubritalea profundi]PQJ27668.1 hypothetical protein BSZ32_03575 [Rubritalea profundi]
MNTIILAAGEGNFLEMVRGKPAIAWSLSKFSKNDHCVIVVRKTNTKLIQYLKSTHVPRIGIRIELYDETEVLDNVLYSLHLGLKSIPEKYGTRVVLGDTCVDQELPKRGDFFVCDGSVRVSKNWCLVSMDTSDRILQYFDKQEGVDLTDKSVLVGYYSMTDTALLKVSVWKALKNGECELSGAFAKYGEVKPIYGERCQKWFDFGHISGLVEARLAFFNAREFNSMSVDPARGTIIKSSRKKQKLLDEANWYRDLPLDLSVLAPRVIKAEDQGERFILEMELFGYPNLAEIFVYGENSTEDWLYILDKLFLNHKLLEQYKSNIEHEALEYIYKKKTEERVLDLKKIQGLQGMVGDDFIEINGLKLRNLPLLEDAVRVICAELCDTDCAFTITHGDYCFSNILFDEKHFIFRLIDPRGRFKNSSIYGDPRYDIAKLRHSAVGFYDFIVLGMYSFRSSNDGSYELNLVADIDQQIIEEHFNRLVENQGFNVNEIKKIEALLFLTMIPLHEDDESRQRALYLIAIQKLNEVV